MLSVYLQRASLIIILTVKVITTKKLRETFKKSSLIKDITAKKLGVLYFKEKSSIWRQEIWGSTKYSDTAQRDGINQAQSYFDS